MLRTRLTRSIILALAVLGLAIPSAASATTDGPPLTKRDARAFLVSVVKPNATQVLAQLDRSAPQASAFVSSTDSARRVGKSAVIVPVTFIVNRDGNAQLATVKFVVRRSTAGTQASIWLAR